MFGNSIRHWVALMNDAAPTGEEPQNYLQNIWGRKTNSIGFKNLKLIDHKTREEYCENTLTRKHK